MKLEAGKRYVRRDGTISGELELYPRGWLQDPDTSLFFDPSDEEFGHLVFVGTKSCAKDLVKEYEGDE